MRVIFCVLLGILLGSMAPAEPIELWHTPLGGSLEYAPLVGSFSPTPGYEAIVALSDPAVVVCLNARGEVEWREEIEGNQKVTALSAATMLLPPSDALVAVAGDRDIVCLYAESGAWNWREDVGALSPGGMLWADLEYIQREYLVASTQDLGVIAFMADGTEHWRYNETDHGTEFNVVAAMAAGDINNDRLGEVVVPLEKGMLALDSLGTMLWETPQAREIASAPLVADCDGNMTPEIYVLTQNPPGLWAVDGDLGTERWFHPFEADELAVELGKSELLLVDFNQNGQWALVVGGADGGVAAVRHDGTRLWSNPLGGTGAVRLGAADLNGDMRVDVLAVGADGHIWQLDPWGGVLWSTRFKEPASFSPIILDMDLSFSPNALLVSDKGDVRCMQFNAAHIPGLMAWPMARNNPARTGFARELAPWKTDEAEPVLGNGDFEYVASATAESQDALPVGWTLAAESEAAWGTSTDKAQSGARALWVEPGESAVRVQSEARLLPAGLQKVKGEVQFTGGGEAKAYLQWYNTAGELLREEEFTASAAGETWTRLALNSTAPPANAHTLTLALESPGGTGERVWWDSAQLEARVAQAPAVEILYNQVGYETYAPKKFAVRTNWKARNARFAIFADDGKMLHDGELTWGVRFKAGGGVEWPGYYWRGDFSELFEEGSIQIGVRVDDVQVLTPYIKLGHHAVWETVIPLALEGLNAALCGDAEKGKAWHTEPNGSVGRTPELFWELAQSRQVCWWRFEKIDSNKNGKDDLLEMLLPVADGLAASIDSDGRFDAKMLHSLCGAAEAGETPGDSAMLAAMGLGRFSHLLKGENQGHLSAAMRALDWCVAQEVKSPLLFNVPVDLARISEENKLRDLVDILYTPVKFEGAVDSLAASGADAARIGDLIEAYVAYEGSFTSETQTFWIALDGGDAAEELIRKAQNPFGVFMYDGGEGGRLQMFPPTAGLGAYDGHTRHILNAATFVSQIYRFRPSHEQYAFVMDQLNWLLGCNPFGVSLLTGAGVRPAPGYALPEGMDISSGTPGGLLPRGPVATSPGDDRPRFAPETAPTHDVDLYNTVALINVLSHIKRMPVGLDDR